MNGFTRLYHRLREPNVRHSFHGSTIPLQLNVNNCFFCNEKATVFLAQLQMNYINTLRLESFDPETGDSDLEVFACCPTCYPVCSKIVELFERSKK